MMRTGKQLNKGALKYALLSLLLFFCLMPVSPVSYAEPDPDEDLIDRVANTFTSGRTDVSSEASRMPSIPPNG